jgi:hypothetical protein
VFGGGSLSDAAGVGSHNAVRQCGARGRILRAVCRAHVRSVDSFGTKEKQKVHLTAQVGQIAQRLAAVIWQVLQFIWNWSLGQVVKMFQMSFNNLPVWKQVLFVVVIAALAYFLYKVAKDLLKAVQHVLGAIVGLISALIAMLPQIVYAYRFRWSMDDYKFQPHMDSNRTAIICQ